MYDNQHHFAPQDCQCWTLGGPHIDYLHSKHRFHRRLFGLIFRMATKYFHLRWIESFGSVSWLQHLLRSYIPYPSQRKRKENTFTHKVRKLAKLKKNRTIEIGISVSDFLLFTDFLEYSKWHHASWKIDRIVRSPHHNNRSNSSTWQTISSMTLPIKHNCTYLICLLLVLVLFMVMA